MYCADAKQDQFVSTILQNKTNGTYLDIGSCHPIGSNNTYHLESQLKWRGTCIEINPEYSENLYKTIRPNTRYINSNVFQVDLIELFNCYYPSQIDYLSLDVDEKSVDVLKLLPLHDYRFNIITIEHDFYLYGDKYRKQQRDILVDNGYYLLFGNVLVEQGGFEGKICPFEDWYVDGNLLPASDLYMLQSTDLYPSLIINKIESFYNAY